MVGFGEVQGCTQAILSRPLPGEGVKFSIVGRQDGGSASAVQYIHMPGDGVYAVSVQDHGTGALFQHLLHHLLGLGQLAQTGAR